jgi:N-acetylglutamate synthase-like GNAT family acetyltransferase
VHRAEIPTVPADTIRLATAADAPAVERLIKYSHLAGASAGDERKEARALFESAFASRDQAVRDGTCHVAESAGEIIGTCVWTRGADLARCGMHAGLGWEGLAPRCGAPVASVLALAVHPAYPRLTLSRLMLILCESAAVRRGVDSLEAFTTRADRWVFLACGYQPVQPRQRRCPRGVIVPGLVVRKRLCATRPLFRPDDPLRFRGLCHSSTTRI